MSHENVSTQPAQNRAIWVDFTLQKHPLLPLKQGYLTQEMTHRLLPFDTRASSKISQKKLLPGIIRLLTLLFNDHPCCCTTPCQRRKFRETAHSLTPYCITFKNAAL
jgi:hypothetical protein